MKTGQRKKLILLAFVLVLTGLIVGATKTLRQTLLSDYATRLPCPDADYVWQSPHEIVTFATSALPSPPGSGSGAPPQFKVNAVRTDIITGNQTTLSEFNALFPKHTPIAIPGWNPSPNGVWLAYWVKDSQSYGGDPLFSSLWELSGTRSFPSPELSYNNFPASNPFSQTWLPDSRRYLVLDRVTAGRANLYSLDIPNRSGIPIPLPLDTQSLLGVTADYLLITSDFDLFSPDPLKSRGPLKKFTLSTQGIYPNAAPLHTLSINLPAGATVQELSLSPQADRLLWTLSFTRRAPFAALLTRIFPKLSTQFKAHTLTTIQISRLDGSRMRELGAEDNPTGKNPEPIHTVRWLPDGKHISYRFQNAIYIVHSP